MNKRGFSRIELLIAFVLVGLLGSLSIPVIDAQIDRKRTAQCRAQLMEIGRGVCAYVAEHDGRLPDVVAGRTDRGQAVPVMEEALLPYVPGPDIFRCPADRAGLFERSGSSYYWNYFPRVDGDGRKALRVGTCQVAGVRPRSGEFVELLTDKEPFHKQRTAKNAIYLLGVPGF